jgi:tetratricopeptide (TPR) repeat protein
VVETLADLYGALEDYEGQVPLLEGFLKQAGPEADPESVALVQQKYANVEIQRGNLEHAAKLLAPAMAFWRSDPQRYVGWRLEGMAMQGRLQRAMHDVDGAIETYTEALTERIAFSGKNHPETANLYNSLALAYSTANRFNEAMDAWGEALTIHNSLQSTDDLEALIMRGNMGVSAARYGQIDEAERVIRDAFQKQQALSGDSATVAQGMAFYGAILSLRERHEDAVKMLRDSIDMATQFTGVASPLSVQNRLFLAEAYMAAGQNDLAAKVLDEDLQLARRQLGADSLHALRIRLAQARLVLAGGNAARADDDLRALVEPLRKIGPVARPFLAQVMVARGDALIAQSKMSEAVPILAEAVRMREHLLWDQSWELAEARARLGEALGTEDPHARQLLAQAVAVLESQLGPQHPQTIRARKLLSG